MIERSDQPAMLAAKLTERPGSIFLSKSFSIFSTMAPEEGGNTCPNDQFGMRGGQRTEMIRPSIVAMARRAASATSAHHWFSYYSGFLPVRDRAIA